MKPRWLVVVLGLGMLGCLNPQTRMQKPDDEGKDGNVRVVGDVCGVALDESEVLGVGLVVGLNGTGGGAPPASNFRTLLENDLKRRNIRDIKGMLDSPNNAMVIVTARIPAGVRKNDPLDVQVSLPEQSRCTSLQGGFLLECELRAYESAKRLVPKYQGPDHMKSGYVMVKAEGQILVGVNGTGKAAASERASDDSNPGDDDLMKVGRIWGGGRSLVDPPLLLTLNADTQSARMAAAVAERINATFPGNRQGREAIALASNKSLIMLGVPMHYRHDLMHYLAVVRAIPLDRTPPPEGAYRKKLAEQLLDPALCLQAAIRLEALGEDTAPALRLALSAPSPLSRFAAAQALAYLRKPICAEELSRLAREHPILRAHCLTALSSLNESACQMRLADLMRDKEPELRYAAFRGLHRLDDRHPDVTGVRLNESFWLHQVAADSAPMIHFLTTRRPEIVLFGDKQTFVPAFRFAVGAEFTVTADKDAQVCTIKRFSVKHGQPVRQCSLTAADVLKNLAEIGGSYADAVDLLQKADAASRLNCAVFHDALPRPADVRDLAKLGKQDPTLRSATLLTASPLSPGGQ